ncbi:MAG: pantoate--beta-alanine ligase [Candidatus Muproteobacteria bacterium RIFCSPHIGHO2_12_FULL_60_33]|uniref:Pantothenate synthetase n=1 Tax=Candidatus Muproteobacteria bacterium RIFCSPLOWO2_01_FULL_60_18 TaxID=1817768 RepID=A0A1F6U2Q3_9PROT|nr:MAG: pantoate--beta-alanine ligase [Candidatus Muproteobacteria bacterium RIFCSPHIGHO2_01_60_12]OGI51646.1 MAG: pantoate--beta-alanine ligase [Candidatus Muproteobacteria bacterium RIFCSPLOWO2_01_FULL_60_18]OGI56444.1 MAG: pantoate--beta-alanine ligase [Candidatus Muproteobacteria bacterium RIFCSPHIGHO2_12_FULL_60_33]OGI60016.1 MAG: pantoate--beta-alanine ligase [Candidatus Muproteobacteria bacterium RIFCSPHIGHO2_01_FULL_61_200]
MITVETVVSLREQIARLRQSDKRIAFVPTLGNLHAGHMRLMQEARHHAQAVVASIYVNPLQFGQNEDFDSYPRTPSHDKVALLSAGVDLLFRPAESEMYPHGRAAQTVVEVPGLSDELCGAFRPGHFRGVTTVVNRLFNLVTPDVAVFGKKDYQQWLLVRLMTADLGLPVEIIGVDTVREPDGLALSSRNNYLSPDERKVAPHLYEALGTLRDRFRDKGLALETVEENAIMELEADGFRPDYVSVRRQQDLQKPGPDDRQLVALAAAWLGQTRLIDNVEFELKS